MTKQLVTTRPLPPIVTTHATMNRTEGLIRVSIVGIAVAGIVAVTIVGIISHATAPVPKPAPVIPEMDMRQFWKSDRYHELGRDLHGLGKIGPSHDQWILRQYRPQPAPKTPPAKPKASATSRDA